MSKLRLESSGRERQPPQASLVQREAVTSARDYIKPGLSDLRNEPPTHEIGREGVPGAEELEDCFCKGRDRLQEIRSRL